MLKRSNRLHKQRQIDLIFKAGRRFHTKNLTIHVYWDKKGVDELPKSTVVVSKKVSKQAVRRNRIKRQVRAIIEEILPEMPKNLLFIVVVRADISRFEHITRQQEVYTLLQNAKIWTPTK